MTVRTRAQLNSDADTLLADNTAGEISPQDVRERIKDLADSSVLPEDQFPLNGYTTTATAAGTTTLTAASNYNQYFTGSTTQTIVLPVTSTLALGRSFRIVNLSTGTVTVNSSGGNLVATVAAGQTSVVTCILTSGTTAASWSAVTSAASPAGLVLLTSGIVSAAATLDIVLTSYTAYRGVLIELVSFLPATDSVALWVRTSTDGGSSYAAAASDYAYQYNVVSGGTNNPGQSIGAAQMLLLSPIGNASNEGVSSTIKLMGQAATSPYGRIRHDSAYIDFNGNFTYGNGAGARLAAADIDAIRVLFSSGNIASGGYAVYGYV